MGFWDCWCSTCCNGAHILMGICSSVVIPHQACRMVNSQCYSYYILQQFVPPPPTPLSLQTLSGFFLLKNTTVNQLFLAAFRMFGLIITLFSCNPTYIYSLLHLEVYQYILSILKSNNTYQNSIQIIHNAIMHIRQRYKKSDHHNPFFFLSLSHVC